MITVNTNRDSDVPITLEATVNSDGIISWCCIYKGFYGFGATMDDAISSAVIDSDDHLN